MTPDAMNGNGESTMSAMLLAAAAAAAATTVNDSSRASESTSSTSRKRKATPSSSCSASPEIRESESLPVTPATPTNAKILKMRKLKSYSVEEKLDIIDYAKVIGNRAAGREFNVAESSIREWRKNEDKIRQMAEVSPSKCKSETKSSRNGAEEVLDRKLVAYIENTHDVTWHDIGLKANDLWREANSEKDCEEADSEFNANMGWVSRFFKRVQDRVRPIPPPVSNPVSTHPFSEPVSMVQPTPLEMPTGAVAEAILSQSVSKRRKPLNPQRVDRPTLRLSPQQITDCESGAPSLVDSLAKNSLANADLNTNIQEENFNVTG